MDIDESSSSSDEEMASNTSKVSDDSASSNDEEVANNPTKVSDGLASSNDEEISIIQKPLQGFRRLIF